VSEDKPQAPILSNDAVHRLLPYALALVLGGGAGTASGLLGPDRDQDRLVERVTILEVRLDTLIEGSERIEDLLREIMLRESHPR
jgi:hypothetical protein